MSAAPSLTDPSSNNLTSSPDPNDITLRTDGVQDGWHLIQYVDGEVAVVEFDNGKWHFGSQPQPNSVANSITFVGKTDSDIGANVSQWQNAIKGLSSTIIGTLTVQDDAGGNLRQGHPIVIKADGQIAGPSAPNAGDATATTGIPGANATGTAVTNAVSAITSPLGFFTSSGFWKGIGLVAAGGLILVFAALEFYKMSGV